MLGLRRRRRRDEYPLGSCTRYVYDTVPWVPLGWGDAYQWPYCAATIGLKVTPLPDARALVVFPPGPEHGLYGHVAKVVSVFPPNTLTVVDHATGRYHDVDLTGWPPVGAVHYILPPDDKTVRLPRGPLHNGQGQSAQVIADVITAWDDFVNYWNFRAGLQHDIFQLVSNSLNQFI